ncbi:dTMP kinase [Rhodococcus rhodnii]|uniref:Thymidylate kinase n=2 Tax=Rhodococcus rhodnii TaxID=38312 RepID=R7WJB9_9NOCA|nr:dTMP kinase [Rhodococcus rhodnii]EOM75372.1 thymidylate kinase [Rhodococcus rhodnii LMG 5362]TXG90582.1 dTMP kinase [Rhodococcus rhodnii]
MGALVALEGLDGAGKNTLVQGVLAALTDRGLAAATLAFPRYGRSVHADVAAEALHGRHGDLAESVNAMAMLFALDRAGAAAELAELVATHDVVVLDRYVASNAAYGAARLAQDADGPFVDWIRELEFERFALPVPDLQLYLDTPVTLAELRARARESEVCRALDAYERDSPLQTRTGRAYAGLAARAWMSPWWVLDPEVDVARLADDLALSTGS